LIGVLMDAAILRTLLTKVIELDEANKIKANLGTVRDTVSNLTSNPAEPTHQTAFSDAFKKLKASFIKMGSRLTPGDCDVTP